MTAKKTDSPTIVDGVKIYPDAIDINDYEIVELIAPTVDESLTEEERATATTVMVAKMPKLLFGNDWNRIKRELREANGGGLTGAQVNEFLGHVFEVVNRKNS